MSYSQIRVQRHKLWYHYLALQGFSQRFTTMVCAPQSLCSPLEAATNLCYSVEQKHVPGRYEKMTKR